MLPLRYLSNLIHDIPPTSIIIITSAILAVILYYFVFKTSSSLPPGPTGLPILGYWPFFTNEKCVQQLDTLKDTYGDIYSFNSTGYLYISLGSIKAVKEVHITKSDCFAERISPYTLMVDYFKDGVFATNGETWKVLRKFFLQSFRDRVLTSIKDRAITSLQDSINSSVDFLKSKDGQQTDILELLTTKCISYLRVTLFGESGMSEEQILELNRLYGIVIAGMTPKNVLLTGPIGKYVIFPLTPSFRSSLHNHKKIEAMLTELIAEQFSTYDENNIRSVIDDFYFEKLKRIKNSDPTAKYFTDQALRASLIQFLGDGVLGVAGLISLFFKSLMKHPEEQEKLYKEILDVVGADRDPSIEDKTKMTYTNAFLLETLRMHVAEMFPFFPSLQCTKETTIRGYRIPKGTISLVNMYSAHKDPETYEEPETFNPSRYISVEGKRRAELPLTFGMGKRSCLGEGFIMLQAFLFVTTLVKHFKFEFPENAEKKTNTFDAMSFEKLLVCANCRHTVDKKVQVN